LTSLTTRVSPVSGSVSLDSTPRPADSEKAVLSSVDTLSFTATGASFTFSTVRTKRSEAVLPALSAAVRRIVSVPTSALPGVPVKTPVAELNVSHVGSGSPLVLDAVMVSGSPASSSANALVGTVRLNAVPWVAVALLTERLA
jgi:hypothetical protein